MLDQHRITAFETLRFYGHFLRAGLDTGKYSHSQVPFHFPLLIGWEWAAGCRGADYASTKMANSSHARTRMFAPLSTASLLFGIGFRIKISTRVGYEFLLAGG